MKKTISIVLALSLLIIAMPQITFAADYTVQYSDLTINNGVIVKCNTTIKTTSDQTTIIPSEYTDSSNNTIKVTAIASSAFLGNSSIKGPLVISEGITSIGASAFQSCSGITSVTLPSTIQSIGTSAFRGCSSVKQYTINGENSYYKTVDGSLLSYDGTKYVEYACGQPKIIEYIPEGVQTVCASSLRSAKNLKYIVFPTTLQKIESATIMECTSLYAVAFLGMTAPTIDSNNFQAATITYYPSIGSSYQATTFTSKFIAGTSFIGYTSFNEAEFPPPYTTPSPTQTPIPSNAPITSPTPTPDGLSITFSSGIINALVNYSGDNTYKLIVAQYEEDGRLSDVALSASNTISMQKAEGATVAKAFAWTDKIEPLFEVKSVSLNEVPSLKILIIGNSYSNNAKNYINDIAMNLGVQNIITGDLKISASTLQNHCTNIEKNNSSYVYYKRINNGDWVSSSTTIRMEDGLKDEAWDYIVIQEHAFQSTNLLPDYYFSDYLTELVNYINSVKTNPNAKIGFYQLWGYASYNVDPLFQSLFGNSQIAMYNAIVSSIEQNVATRGDIDFIVPVGTTIQNCRTSLLGDNTINDPTDGHHLTTLGCYIAGMAFAAKITGLDINNVTWMLNKQYPANYLPAIKEATQNAINKPYEVSQTSYPN